MYSYTKLSLLAVAVAATGAEQHANGKASRAEYENSKQGWVYDRYATDKRLYPIQAEAQADRRGLWVDAAPVPPWEWRKSRRNGKGA